MCSLLNPTAEASNWLLLCRWCLWASLIGHEAQVLQLKGGLVTLKEDRYSVTNIQKQCDSPTDCEVVLDTRLEPRFAVMRGRPMSWHAQVRGFCHCHPHNKKQRVHASHISFPMPRFGGADHVSSALVFSFWASTCGANARVPYYRLILLPT